MKITNIKANYYNFINFKQNLIKKNVDKELKADTFEKCNLSFKGQPCSADDFKIKALYDIPCPCCGTNMVTNSQLNSFVNSVCDRKGDELVKVLKRYDKYYRPVEKDVVAEISKYAVLYPNLNVEELTKTISVFHRENLQNEQREILDELKSFAPLLNKETSERYKKYIDDSYKLIETFTDEQTFKRKSFISNLENICSTSTSKENQEKILKVAQKLPTSSNSASAFFIKYSRRGQFEIANRLLNSALGTTEHVQPKSKDGQNNTMNYIAMCADCNSKRGNMPYGEWFVYHPEMPANLQKYLDEVVKRIVNKEVRGYNSYPEDVVKAIRKETKGKVNLIINEVRPDDDYAVEIPKGATKAERIALMEKSLADKKLTLEKLKKTEQDLRKDKEYKILVELEEIKKELEKLVKEKNEVSNGLNDVRKAEGVHAQRVAKIEAIKKQLADPNISKKEEATLKDKLSKLEKRMEKEVNYEEERKTLSDRYDELKVLIAEKTAELEEKKTKIKLPSDYAVQEKELLEKLEIIYALKRKITTNKTNIEDKKSVLERKNEIMSELKSLKGEVAFFESSCLDIEPNNDAINKYNILIKKLSFIESIDSARFRSAFKAPKGIKSDFILDEAKKSIREQIAVLTDEPAVRNKINIDRIEALEDEKEECNLRLAKIASIEASIVATEKELAELEERDGKEEILVRNLEKVRLRKKIIEDKIKDLDIRKRITILEDTIARHANELANLRNLPE